MILLILLYYNLGILLILLIIYMGIFLILFMRFCVVNQSMNGLEETVLLMDSVVNFVLLTKKHLKYLGVL